MKKAAGEEVPGGLVASRAIALDREYDIVPLTIREPWRDAQPLFLLLEDDDPGVTISIRLVVCRPMPTLRKRRSIQGVLERTGTPYSFRSSLSRLTPPSSTVPPSGTVTVVDDAW